MKVDRRTILKALEKETPVLVPAGETVDPYYLQVVKDGTLLIVPPRNFFAPRAGPGDEPERPRK